MGEGVEEDRTKTQGKVDTTEGYSWSSISSSSSSASAAAASSPLPLRSCLFSPAAEDHRITGRKRSIQEGDTDSGYCNVCMSPLPLSAVHSNLSPSPDLFSNTVTSYADGHSAAQLPSPLSPCHTSTLAAILQVPENECTSNIHMYDMTNTIPAAAAISTHVSQEVPLTRSGRSVAAS